MRHRAEGGGSGHESPFGRVHDYQHRPAEELYDCETDTWMHQRGDEGQPTEMKALERMPKAAKNGGNEPKKKKDTGKKKTE